MQQNSPNQENSGCLKLMLLHLSGIIFACGLWYLLLGQRDPGWNLERTCPSCLANFFSESSDVPRESKFSEREEVREQPGFIANQPSRFRSEFACAYPEI